jgi:hypothetical protein
MPDILLCLNPNEPNPNFMMFQEQARPILLKSLMGRGKYYWVKGKTGMGKSTFLLWLREFSSIYKIRPIYLQGGEKKSIAEFKELMEKAITPTFFPRIFYRSKATNKPILLIIDDIDYFADNEIFEYISSLIENPDVQLSLVFSSKGNEKKIMGKFKQKAIEEISLEKPSKGVLMDMVSKRIEAGGGKKFQPFGMDLVEKIVDESNTPREVLAGLEKSHKKKLSRK